VDWSSLRPIGGRCDKLGVANESRSGAAAQPRRRVRGGSHVCGRTPTPNGARLQPLANPHGTTFAALVQRARSAPPSRTANPSPCPRTTCAERTTQPHGRRPKSAFAPFLSQACGRCHPATIAARLPCTPPTAAAALGSLSLSHPLATRAVGRARVARCRTSLRSQPLRSALSRSRTPSLLAPSAVLAWSVARRRGARCA
jgi:hypothetical protein